MPVLPRADLRWLERALDTTGYYPALRHLHQDRDWDGAWRAVATDGHRVHMVIAGEEPFDGISSSPDKGGSTYPAVFQLIHGDLPPEAEACEFELWPDDRRRLLLWLECVSRAPFQREFPWGRRKSILSARVLALRSGKEWRLELVVLLKSSGEYAASVPVHPAEGSTPREVDQFGIDAHYLADALEPADPKAPTLLRMWAGNPKKPLWVSSGRREACVYPVLL